MKNFLIKSPFSSISEIGNLEKTEFSCVTGKETTYRSIFFSGDFILCDEFDFNVKLVLISILCQSSWFLDCALKRHSNLKCSFFC